MSVEISPPLKRLWALLTLEWQLSPVTLHVGVKVAFVFEFGRTLLTCVGVVLSLSDVGIGEERRRFDGYNAEVSSKNAAVVVNSIGETV